MRGVKLDVERRGRGGPFDDGRVESSQESGYDLIVTDVHHVPRHLSLVWIAKLVVLPEGLKFIHGFVSSVEV
jgi:hypothetical protein